MQVQAITPGLYQREVEIPIRVRYCETDQMGVVHHSNYLRYFEVARMEQFRSWGAAYGEIERAGILLMIMDMQCQCRSPAYFDELIHVRTRIHKMTRFRIIHHYKVRGKNDRVIAVGKTALAPVSKEGLPLPLPEVFWSISQTLDD